VEAGLVVVESVAVLPVVGAAVESVAVDTTGADVVTA
jgi:hypothetical protein